MKDGIHKAPNSCKPSSEQVINFLEDMRYYSGTYLDYENSLMRQGRTEEADKVYIARKERERLSLPWYKSVGNTLLNFFVGYGRHLERSYITAVIFFVFGWLVAFKEQNMVPINQDPKITYSPFWFSLNSFLPVIGDLHAEKWIPKNDIKGLVLYWRIHNIAGWILLPLILAASAGLLE